MFVISLIPVSVCSSLMFFLFCFVFLFAFFFFFFFFLILKKFHIRAMRIHVYSKGSSHYNTYSCINGLLSFGYTIVAICKPY